MSSFFIYIAKSGEDPLSLADKCQRIGSVGIIQNRGNDRTGGSCFLLPHLPTCDKIKNSGNDTAREHLASLLNDLVTDCSSRYHVVGRNNEVTFLIHFGSQGHDECVDLTKRMNEAAAGVSDLRQFRFIAVSRFNQCPSGFFVKEAGHESKLSIPDEDAVKRLIVKWQSGKSDVPDFDHLRAICLLCKALLELPENERNEKAASSQWWIRGIWGNSSQWQERIYSDEENELIIRAGDPLDTLCRSINSKTSVPAEYGRQETLEKIVTTIKNIFI